MFGSLLRHVVGHAVFELLYVTLTFSPIFRLCNAFLDCEETISIRGRLNKKRKLTNINKSQLESCATINNNHSTECTKHDQKKSN